MEGWVGKEGGAQSWWVPPRNPKRVPIGENLKAGPIASPEMLFALRCPEYRTKQTSRRVSGAQIPAAAARGGNGKFWPQSDWANVSRVLSAPMAFLAAISAGLMSNGESILSIAGPSTAST